MFPWFYCSFSKRVGAACKRSLQNILSGIVFYVGGSVIEYVESYVHLGHIITSKITDEEDILQRRNCFVGQVNNVLCFFRKLDMFTKIKLFKSFCTSFFGCELWALDDRAIDEFCIAWRKSVRRVLDIPYNSHSFSLPVLSDTLPIFDEICKRSARFIVSCLFCPSRLVNSIVWYGVLLGRYNSVVGRNALICCDRYGWEQTDFVMGSINLSKQFFTMHCDSKLTQSDKSTIVSTFEMLCVREGLFSLTNSMYMSRPEIQKLLSVVTCN